MVSGTTVLLGIGKTLERWSVQRMTQTQRQASLCLPGLAVLVSSRSRVPLAPRRRQGRRAVQAHPSYHHRSAARAPQTLLCLHVQLDAISYGIGTIGNLHTGSVALGGVLQDTTFFVDLLCMQVQSNSVGYVSIIRDWLQCKAKVWH